VILLLGLACAPEPTEEDSQPTAPAEASLSVRDEHLAVEVGTPATLAAIASEGTVRWTFGDGAAAEGSEVVHQWAEPGNYTAIAELSAADGRRLTAAVRMEVHLPAAAVAPSVSGLLGVDPEGRVWVVTPEADVVAVLAPDADPVYLPCGDGPRSVSFLGGDAVVSHADGTIGRWSRADLTPLPGWDAGRGSEPWGAAVRGTELLVALGGTGEVLRIPAEGEPEHIPVGPDPRAVAVAPDGTVFVSRFRSAPYGGEVYRLGADPVYLPEHPGPDSDTVTGGVPTLLETLAISPDGGTLYLPVLQANVHRGLLSTGDPLTFETTTRAALGVVAVDAAAEDWADRKVFDNQDRTYAVAPSPTGNYLAVAHPGTGTVQLLDAYSLDLVGSLPGAGAGLRGLVWTADALYTYAWLDRTVSAWQPGEPGAIPTLLWSASTVPAEPLDAEVLAGKRLFHDSGDPRLAKDGYIACASCHPDGTDDGLTWDFTSRGEGIRNTASLEGRAGTGMGWLHWSANFDEVQDFENDIRNAFGGTGLLDDADWAETSDTLGPAKAGRSEELDALAAYVTSLDTTPPSPWAAEVTPERAALYVEAGCAECHPAPLYTDSSLDALRLHDIGTLGKHSGKRMGERLEGLDTPTLLGVWATPPYLHDGSAEDLEAAIGAHVHLDLDPATVAELAAYTRGL